METKTLLTPEIIAILDEMTDNYAENLYLTGEMERGFAWSPIDLDVKYGIQSSGQFSDYLESNEDIDSDDFYNEAADYLEKKLDDKFDTLLNEKYPEYDIEKDTNYQDNYERSYTFNRKITDDYQEIATFDNISNNLYGSSDVRYIGGTVLYSEEKEDFLVQLQEYANNKYFDNMSLQDFVKEYSYVSDILELLENKNVDWVDPDLAIKAGFTPGQEEN